MSENGTGSSHDHPCVLPSFHCHEGWAIGSVIESVNERKTYAAPCIMEETIEYLSILSTVSPSEFSSLIWTTWSSTSSVRTGASWMPPSSPVVRARGPAASAQENKDEPSASFPASHPSFQCLQQGQIELEWQLIEIIFSHSISEREDPRNKNHKVTYHFTWLTCDLYNRLLVP